MVFFPAFLVTFKEEATEILWKRHSDDEQRHEQRLQIKLTIGLKLIKRFSSNKAGQMD